MSDSISCPCCGLYTLSEPGVYEICPICGWEDDPIQSTDPEYDGGANHLSLKQARKKWIENRGKAATNE